MDYELDRRMRLVTEPEVKSSARRQAALVLSGTNHGDDQPIHLRLTDDVLAVKSELGRLGGAFDRHCPAGVLETGTAPRLQIKAGNCDIKGPDGTIPWTQPRGGEGPADGRM